MSTVSAQAIEESLKQCMDPEVPLNIVEMGLIYGIDVAENNDVNIKMTMTTQGCPLHETLVQDATRYYIDWIKIILNEIFNRKFGHKLVKT